jgi:hypothetical protein
LGWFGLTCFCRVGYCQGCGGSIAAKTGPSEAP